MGHHAVHWSPDTYHPFPGGSYHKYVPPSNILRLPATKNYLLVGSIYVLGSVTEYYISLSYALKTLLNISIYRPLLA